MRRSRALILPVLLLLVLSACGGSGSSTDNGNGGQSQSAAQSQAAESQAAESQAAQESQGSNGHTAGDLDSLVSALTPPHASELSKTSAQGGVFIAWNSTDSVDSLKSFYESAIPGTGMTIFSTTSAGGTYAWIFAENEGSSFGGSVTLGPNSDGTDGASVILTATSN
jgi:hypothetical protein